MSVIVCQYRIYPSWFRGGDDVGAPIKELAEGAARRMNLMVGNVVITKEGEDRRGRYIDFAVSYVDSILMVRP
jgi:hypothetical protein